jgi:anaerobic magnesium-protoporphyrin IX monomethyl ester cyclase
MLSSKKICFLVPKAKGFRQAERIFGCNYAFFFQQNIFLLYPATVLRQAGFQVSVVDCIIEKASLDKVMKGGHGVYVFYSVSLSRAVDLEASEFIEKTIGPDIPIIYLGPDPTFYPEKYLLSANRYVIRGEPEYGLLDLLQNISGAASQIESLSWVNDGRIEHNATRGHIEDLDKLPFPDRSFLKNPGKYYNAKFRKLPSTTILTTRGCSFNCLFCAPNSLSFARELEWKRWHKEKPPLKLRSADNVISEFQEIHSQGYRSVVVLDDQFLWDRDRTNRILEGIKKLGFEISILARADKITDSGLTRSMAEAGIKHIALGVESFNQEILNYINKNLKVEAVNKAIALIKDAGINPEINLMFGSCPLETKLTIEDSIAKAISAGPEIIHAQACTPFPGTGFYTLAKEQGWMTTNDFIPIDSARDAIISYPHLSNKDLIRVTRRFYRSYYFNPRYIFRHLVKLRSWRELTNKVVTGIKICINIVF